MVNEKIYKERIQHWIKRVGDIVYSQPIKLKAEYIYDARNPIPLAEINNHKWQKIEVGEKWLISGVVAGLNSQEKLPSIMKGAWVGAWLDVQGEACIFVDGVPHQGLN